ELTGGLWRDVPILKRQAPRALDHLVRDDVARLDPALDGLGISRADVEPALARVGHRDRVHDVELVAAHDLFQVRGDDRGRTPHLRPAGDDGADLLLAGERAASTRDE